LTKYCIDKLGFSNNTHFTIVEQVLVEGQQHSERT